MQLHPPARSRAGRSKRSGGCVELNTDGNSRGSRSYRIRDLVPPGQLKLKVRFGSTVMEGEGVPPICISYKSGCPDTAVKRLHRGPRQHVTPSTPPHRPDKRIFNVQNGPTISWEGFHQLAFGLGDRGLSAELPDMGLAHVQHHTHPGWCDVTEVCDVANPTRTHLRNEELGLLVDSSDSEWYTELVIEVAGGRYRRTGTLEHLRQ
jgi:hypothetical protein